MNEGELKEYLQNMVLEYASKMNELQNRFMKLEHEEPDVNHFPAYKKEYSALFEKYCTNRKRAYGGHGDSFGFPAQYDKIEEATEKSVELKHKSRAEVYFKTQNFFQSEYLFVVLRKNDEWKIDSYKELQNRYSDAKWENMIL